MARLQIARLSVCVWLAMAGCSKRSAPQAVVQQPDPGPQLKTAPQTPIAIKKEELGKQTWNPEWDKIVEEALPPEMLSARAARDVRGFCPRFGQMQEANKREFWAYFFQALAGAEAGLKPTTNVRHTEPALVRKDTVTGRLIRSEGLLQLTYMDSQRYGCDFDWEHDKSLPEHDPRKTILQPVNNLACGVKILDHQIIDQRHPLLWRDSYWSTLQPGTISYRVFAKQMGNVPRSCGLRVRRERLANGEVRRAALE